MFQMRVFCLKFQITLHKQLSTMFQQDSNLKHLFSHARSLKIDYAINVIDLRATVRNKILLK